MKEQYRELYQLLTLLDNFEFEKRCYKEMSGKYKYDHNEDIKNLENNCNKIEQQIKKTITHIWEDEYKE